jgi:hypothetical protein
VIQWGIICLYNFGAPLTYELADGPVHKRAAIAGEGWFMGVQWPAALVRRKADMKILSVSTKKIRVYEAQYAFFDPASTESPEVQHLEIDVDGFYKKADDIVPEQTEVQVNEDVRTQIPFASNSVKS